MHKEKHTHNSIEYIITIDDLSIGSLDAPNKWRLEVRDQQNSDIVSLILDGAIAEYIEKTYGRNHIQFLTALAKSEISKTTKAEPKTAEPKTSYLDS